MHSRLCHSIAHHARSSSEAGLQKSICIYTLYLYRDLGLALGDAWVF